MERARKGKDTDLHAMEPRFDFQSHKQKRKQPKCLISTLLSTIKINKTHLKEKYLERQQFQVFILEI